MKTERPIDNPLELFSSTNHPTVENPVAIIMLFLKLQYCSTYRMDYLFHIRLYRSCMGG